MGGCGSGGRTLVANWKVSSLSGQAELKKCHINAGHLFIKTGVVYLIFIRKKGCFHLLPPMLPADTDGVVTTGATDFKEELTTCLHQAFFQKQH